MLIYFTVNRIFIKHVRRIQTAVNLPYRISQGGLAATFDLAAFGLYMIAPVKKSVNHSKTLTSMREV